MIYPDRRRYEAALASPRAFALREAIFAGLGDVGTEISILHDSEARNINKLFIRLFVLIVCERSNKSSVFCNNVHTFENPSLYFYY